MTVKKIRTKFGGRCKGCGYWCSPGSIVLWQPGYGLWHDQCEPSGGGPPDPDPFNAELSKDDFE